MFKLLAVLAFILIFQQIQSELVPQWMKVHILSALNETVNVEVRIDKGRWCVQDEEADEERECHENSENFCFSVDSFAYKSITGEDGTNIKADLFLRHASTNTIFAHVIMDCLADEVIWVYAVCKSSPMHLFHYDLKTSFRIRLFDSGLILVDADDDDEFIDCGDRYMCHWPYHHPPLT